MLLRNTAAANLRFAHKSFAFVKLRLQKLRFCIPRVLRSNTAAATRRFAHKSEAFVKLRLQKLCFCIPRVLRSNTAGLANRRFARTASLANLRFCVQKLRFCVQKLRFCKQSVANRRFAAVRFASTASLTELRSACLQKQSFCVHSFAVQANRT